MTFTVDDSPVDEQVRIETAPSKKILIPFLILTVILGLIPIVGWFFLGPIMAIYALSVYLRIGKTFYTVTTQRVIVRKGYLRRHTYQWPLQDISDVSTHEGIWMRIFGLGNVIISWQGAVPTIFGAIPAPQAVANSIHSIMRQSATSQIRDRVVISGVDVVLKKEESKKVRE